MKRLRCAWLTVALAAVMVGGAWAEPAVTVRVDVGKVLRARPPAFLGFSLEKRQLRDHRLRAENGPLVAMMRLLGPGTLRLGGNSVDVTGAATPAQVDALVGLARATGWRVIYGLNLGADDAEAAAQEARLVWARGRDVLLAFEVGNEPDLFLRQKLRPAGWDVPRYLEQFARYRRLLGDLPVSGPGAGVIFESLTWTLPFLEAQGRGLAFASVHFYPTVARTPLPADSPLLPTAAHLLSPRIADAVSTRFFGPQIEAAHRLGIPFRVTESNTTARSGQPGVSDAFVSALWIVDWSLRLQLLGVEGIDVQGDLLSPHDLYSPLRETSRGLEAQPIFHGMLLLGRLREPSFVSATVEGGALRAYALAGRGVQVVLLNEEARAVDVRLDAPGVRGRVMRLSAPSLASRDGVTFGGSAVDPSGAWTPRQVEVLRRDAGGAWRVPMPAWSAALVELER